jgi:hypothetical protein
MCIENRIKEAMIKWILVISVSLIASISSTVLAQSNFGNNHATYLGLDYSFGVRSFKLNTDLSKINGMKVVEEGATLGMLFGNKIVQGKLRQGFFYSAASVKYTTNLSTTEAEININPLQMIHVRFRTVEPYLMVGVERNAIKLHGSYVGKEYAGAPAYGNSSTEEQPYLGQIVVMRANVGMGLQYRIRCERSFVRIFTEARYGTGLVYSTKADWFKNTKTSNITAVSVGVSFGYLR